MAHLGCMCAFQPMAWLSWSHRLQSCILTMVESGFAIKHCSCTTSWHGKPPTYRQNQLGTLRLSIGGITLSFPSHRPNLKKNFFPCIHISMYAYSDYHIQRRYFCIWCNFIKMRSGYIQTPKEVRDQNKTQDPLNWTYSSKTSSHQLRVGLCTCRTNLTEPCTNSTASAGNSGSGVVLHSMKWMATSIWHHVKLVKRLVEWSTSWIIHDA